MRHQGPEELAKAKKAETQLKRQATTATGQRPKKRLAPPPQEAPAALFASSEDLEEYDTD